MSITEGTETLDEGEKEAFAALLFGGHQSVAGG